MRVLEFALTIFFPPVFSSTPKAMKKAQLLSITTLKEEYEKADFLIGEVIKI